MRKERKTYLWPKRRRRGLLGLFFVWFPLSSSPPSHQSSFWGISHAHSCVQAPHIPFGWGGGLRMHLVRIHPASSCLQAWVSSRRDPPREQMLTAAALVPKKFVSKMKME